MSSSIRYAQSSDRMPTTVAALVFIVPGIASFIFGTLTWFGLTWVPNPSIGLLTLFPGVIWAVVGLAVYRFQRWVVLDHGKGTVMRGTRTLFTHPAEQYGLDRFSTVDVVGHEYPSGRCYAVALRWREDKRPRGAGSTHPDFWLQTYATVEEARTEARQVADLVKKQLVDRTRGEK